MMLRGNAGSKAERLLRPLARRKSRNCRDFLDIVGTMRQLLSSGVRDCVARLHRTLSAEAPLLLGQQRAPLV